MHKKHTYVCIICHEVLVHHYVCPLQKITRTFKPALNILETEHEELQRKVVSSKEVIHQKEQEIIELKVLDKV